MTPCLEGLYINNGGRRLSITASMPFLSTKQWLAMLPKRFTVFIDHDSCTMYGNDFNDLVWILQLMNFPRHVIISVMRRLLNPAMAEAMRRIESLGHTVRVCVYTHKAYLIDSLADTGALRASNGDLYFPASTFTSHLACADANARLAFDRLFYSRQIIGEALGRKDVEMVVTKHTKSTHATCTSTLKPPADPEYGVLYDDNSAYGDAIVVPAFEAISKANAQTILEMVGHYPVPDYVADIVREDMDEDTNSLTYDNHLTIATTELGSYWPMPSACRAAVSLEHHLSARGDYRSAR